MIRREIIDIVAGYSKFADTLHEILPQNISSIFAMPAKLMDLRTRQLFRILIPFLDVALKLPSPVREVRRTDWITQPICGFCPPSTLTRRSCPSFFTLTCSKYPHTSRWTVKIFSVSSIIPSIFDTPLPRCQKVPAILQRAIFVYFNMRA